MRISVNKHYYSLLACVVISVIFFQHRLTYPGVSSSHKLQLTTWDAFGYYLFLPGSLIYNDVTTFEWLPEIDSLYNVTGGEWVQLRKADNGNYVGKYFVGVSLLQFPYFLIGHGTALLTDYKSDGFSPPYQWSLGIGMLIFCIASLFLLRHILLMFFDDLVVALTLILVMLASNAIQYLAIENAMSHAPLFVLYVIVLYTTIKWHETPKYIWAGLTGYVIGLAAICRPTEIILILIPILWNTQNKISSEEKWAMVKLHRNHIYTALGFGILGVLPQLIYWQYVTGFFIYDVGSAWDFLTPHFRVLIGWEKGWVIYTPVALLFVTGLFFIKKYPFRKAVIYFCLINIYIIISWRDWRYGASYSTRVLVQSYPLFALALAAFIKEIHSRKWAIPLLVVGSFLIFVNLFQVKQYFNTFLHYNDMNRQYYSQIYLKSTPTPIDVSLLDTEDWISDEADYEKDGFVFSKTPVEMQGDLYSIFPISELNLTKGSTVSEGIDCYLKISCDIHTDYGLSNSFLILALHEGDSVLPKKIRLFSPISANGFTNSYASYVEVPEYFSDGTFSITLTPGGKYKGTLKQVSVTRFRKR